MTRTIVVVFVFVCVFATAGRAQPNAVDGARLYKERCARCHDGNIPQVLASVPLRQRSAGYIYEVLSLGWMRPFTGPLTAAERRAVAEHASKSSPGSLKPPRELLPDTAFCGAGTSAPSKPLSASNWNGWGVNLRNTRFQSLAAAGLTAEDVPKLRLKWAFGFPGGFASGSQATVVGAGVFVGSRTGLVYSLNAQSGCIHWVFEAEAGVRSAISVGSAESGRYAAYFGDSAANVYAVDVETGKLRWKVNVEDHPAAIITGAPALYGERLYVPVSSWEELSSEMPTYECCTFRGSIVALETATGKQVWKTYAIDRVPQPTDKNKVGTQRWGPSGAGIWSAPTLDPGRNRLYVATGDSYSDPPAAESDAILALDLDTGKVVWAQQTTPGDAWNAACLAKNEEHRVGCPDSAGPDFDYGSSVALTTSRDGRQTLVAGQKSGVMYGLNPDTGEILWRTKVSDGGVLGGIEWGFATDDETVYASISDTLEKPPGQAGGLAALRVGKGEIVWHAPPFQDTCGGREGCHTGQPGAVTAISGVVFSGSLDGRFRAYSAETGRVIWDFDTVRDYKTVNGVPARGGALSGPGATVAGGMVYVNSGYGIMNFMPGNVLLAFSIEGR